MAQTNSYAIRLRPGDDLKESLQAFVDAKQIAAGWVAACAGSLTDYHIRFANVSTGSKASGHFEIVSLTGTLSTNGSHLHIAVSDAAGGMLGGHLLNGNLVYTTAEVIIQSAPALRFERAIDGTTPWQELQITELKIKEP